MGLIKAAPPQNPVIFCPPPPHLKFFTWNFYKVGGKKTQTGGKGKQVRLTLMYSLEEENY